MTTSQLLASKFTFTNLATETCGVLKHQKTRMACRQASIGSRAAQRQKTKRQGNIFFEKFDVKYTTQRYNNEVNDHASEKLIIIEHYDHHST